MRGFRACILIGAALLWGACSSQSERPEIINQAECSQFSTAKPKTGVLYFMGNSDWHRDQNKAKIESLNNAQVSIASFVQSEIRHQCTQSSSLVVAEKTAKESLNLDCKTQISVRSDQIDIPPTAIAYCLETQHFGYETAYRATSRIIMNTSDLLEVLRR